MHFTPALTNHHTPYLLQHAPQTVAMRNFYYLTLMLLGSALIAISAKFQIPFYPVPITMQTSAVLLIGLLYGWRLGMGTLALYLLEGAAGLPVFAKGAGLTYMLGGTGGYLLGYLLAVGLIGWLAEQGWDRIFWKALIATLCGSALILTLGVAWLSLLIGTEKAIFAGLLPFLAGDLLKAIIAAAFSAGLWQIHALSQHGK